MFMYQRHLIYEAQPQLQMFDLALILSDTDTLMKIHTDTNTKYQIQTPKKHTDTDTLYKIYTHTNILKKVRTDTDIW